MKTHLIAVLCCICHYAGLAQQDTMENKFLLNFVIPDMPAYKSLGVEKSTILRPADVRQFAVMLSPFYSNGKTVIPTNFGLEFAPWKMASRKWTLQDYHQQALKRFLYSSSFSIASAADSMEYGTKLALGYRFSLLSDKADIIRIAYDKSSEFAARADEGRALKTEFEVYWLSVVNRIPPPEHEAYLQQHRAAFTEWLAGIDANSSQLDQSLKMLVFRTRQLFGEAFDFADFRKMDFDDTRGLLLNKLIVAYKQQHWNASRFDAAISWVAESKDSLAGHARFSSFNVWATQALQVGRKGQLLIGGYLQALNAAADTTQNMPMQMTLNTRLLLGNAHFRFFGEAQWKRITYGQLEQAILLNLGGEIRISDKFWVVASGGVDNLKNKEAGNWYSQLVASLDVRYGFNL